MAILPTGKGDITSPRSWGASVVATIDVGGDSSLYYGYDEYVGDTPVDGPFGSISGASTPFGTIVQVVAQEGGDNFQIQVDGGAAGAPAQAAFTSVQVIDGSGNHSYNSSSATYTTDGSVAKWHWGGALPSSTIPNTWTVVFTGGLALKTPPPQWNNVPQNLNYPRNGDGRYWWVGNLDTVLPGPIYFIGDPTYLVGNAALTWQITELSTDGSSIVLQYSTDGGATWTTTTLPGGNQGLQSGKINVDLTSATGFAVQVSLTGGNSSSSATMSELAVAITRNSDQGPVFNFPDPFTPDNYNGVCMDDPGYDDLGTLTTRMLIRLGFANQTETPPPGMTALIQEFLQSSQNRLYRRWSALRTRRFFRWKLVPGQRFYSLMDNDEDVLCNFTFDPYKTIEWVGVQDTRNVWYPVIEGIPPQLYTMLSKPWRPARYEIRQGLEIYPAPDQTYFFWIKGHFGLQRFSEPTDQTTIDSELVFLDALAVAKAHYGQPDANNVMAMENTLRGDLVAAAHKTARYVPGTIAVPPAVRPTLIHYQDNGNG